MAKILYLVHRLPYPPNKGDKLRSFHLLQHLAAQHQVWLGSFVDDPQDWAHLPVLQGLCREVHVAGLNPRRAKLASLSGLLSGEALSLPYYRDASLRRWVSAQASAQRFDAVVVFSSPMAQYVLDEPALRGVPLLVDFVDVDSAKWRDYAQAHVWPLSWLYRREFRTLLDFESRVAQQARCSFFVTESETALFRQLSGSQAPLAALSNGVDSQFFSPRPELASPFAADEQALVFTGAMDYWPNVDAVCWFASEMLPALRERHARLRFVIVGRNPAPAVRALASEAITVTGTVDDVRPYLQHAAAVVAPLRLARGVQNKVLEAMAMAKPVVAARSCVQAVADLGVQAGRDLLAADTPAEYQAALSQLLDQPQMARQLGEQARACVLQHFSWQAHLARLDAWLPTPELAA